MGSQPRGISASRGAAVLGLSEYQTPFSVWQLLMEEREPGWNAAHGYALPPEPDNAAIRFGTAFEDAVVELAERAQGKQIMDRELFYSVNGHPSDSFFERRKGYELANYITCHIDGRYLIQDKHTLHEGKTTSSFAFHKSWGTPGTDRVPQAYQVQVQHQMLCTGADEAIVSVLVFPETPDKWEAMGWTPIKSKDNFRWIIEYFGEHIKGFPLNIKPINWAAVLADMGYFHQYPVRANPEAQRLMVEKYSEFWHNNVLAGKPPEPRSYEDVKRLFPEPKSTFVTNSDYIKRVAARYRGITEETANAKKQKERDKTILTKYMAMNMGSGVIDDESIEAAILLDTEGNRLCLWSKDKNGKLTFRS